MSEGVAPGNDDLGIRSSRSGARGVGDKPNGVRRQRVHFLMEEAEGDVRASGAD